MEQHGAARIPIVIDCDPGIDDACALALAAAHHERLELVGITTVAGNLPVEITTRNALALVELLGIDTPVARGASHPLVRDPVTASDVHGTGGLGAWRVPAPARRVAKPDAVGMLRDAAFCADAANPLVIVAIGPLTNVATLLLAHPEVAGRIGRVVVMGGSAMVGGNITPAAEFNAFADPHAARIVLRSGIPVTLCGLDVTYDCGFTHADIAALAQAGPVSRAYHEMLTAYADGSYKTRALVSAHDVATIAWLLSPALFEGRGMPVEVCCDAGPCLGETVCDRRWWRYDEAAQPVRVLTWVSTEGVSALLLNALHALDARMA